MSAEEKPDCARCGEHPCVGGETTWSILCGRCLVGIDAELNIGFSDLGRYLRGWAEFRTWEASHVS